MTQPNKTQWAEMMSARGNGCWCDLQDMSCNRLECLLNFPCGYFKAVNAPFTERIPLDVPEGCRAAGKVHITHNKKGELEWLFTKRENGEGSAHYVPLPVTPGVETWVCPECGGSGKQTTCRDCVYKIPDEMGDFSCSRYDGIAVDRHSLSWCDQPCPSCFEGKPTTKVKVDVRVEEVECGECWDGQIPRLYPKKGLVPCHECKGTGKAWEFVIERREV